MVAEHFVLNDVKYMLDISPVETFVVPDGTYWQAGHDFQVKHWNYLPRSHKRNKNFRKNPPANALPETVPVYGPSQKDFTPMTEEFQRLWFDLLVLAAADTKQHSEMLGIWRDVTAQGRALTDGLTRTSHNPHRDYVLREQLNADRDMGIKYLTCGGNVVEQKRRSGRKITVRAIDTRKPAPRAEDIWGDWAIIHWATESTMFDLPGKNNWQVSRWHWNRPYGVPFPLLSENGEFEISMDRFHPIKQGQIYSWYNPPTA